MRVPASSRTRQVASTVALHCRHHPDEDRTELVRELNAARAEDWARSVAASAPPLNDEQRARIVSILLGGAS